MMCTTGKNRGQVYRRIQTLEYELDLMYEDKELNAQAIFDFENKKARLEETLEQMKE